MFENTYIVSGFKFQVSSFRFQVSSFRFQVSSFKFQVSVETQNFASLLTTNNDFFRDRLFIVENNFHEILSGSVVRDIKGLQVSI